MTYPPGYTLGPGPGPTATDADPTNDRINWFAWASPPTGLVNYSASLGWYLPHSATLLMFVNSIPFMLGVMVFAASAWWTLKNGSTKQEIEATVVGAAIAALALPSNLFNMWVAAHTGWMPN